VRGVRTGQFELEVARVVLDLSGASLLGSSMPAVPQSRFTIRLTAGSGPSQPVTVVPRRSGTPGAAPRRVVRLGSRGGLAGRDLERIKELIAAGEAVLRGKVICIDAGHGGHSVGAQGVSGLWEKSLCLQMALEAARALQAVGAEVILTRSDDTFVSLDGRVEIANEKGVDLFVSIHCNAMPRRNTMSGTETYYYTAHSLALARALHPQIVGVMGGRDGGIRRRAFAVIRKTQMPSVLLEIGYINHSEDEQKLADAENQRLIGEAIRDGVIAYFNG
jgi:N-acetylmuramoyl-L-alanine amidase